VIAADQRERLFAALAVLADERGYASLRVEDLIARAGISRGAFYEQFGSREECLVAAVGSIVDLALGKVATVDDLLGFAATQPAAARLWLVDAYGAGPAAIEQADRGLAGLRELLTDDKLPPPVAHGLIGGLWRAVATRLRHGREDELPALAAPLAEWLGGYGPPPAPLRRPRGNGAAASTAPAGVRFTPHDQAERILLGVCEAVYEKGYAATTLADIAARASTSIRTFYAHYEGKQEAFIDAIDLAQAQSYAGARSAARRAPDWPHAVRNGIAAICGYFAVEPTLAVAVIVEAHAAGEQALRRREESVAAFAELLEPGYELAPGTHPVVAEAVAGAVDTLLLDAVRAGGGPKVRAIAPATTFVALSPFVGADVAAEVANDIGQPRRRA
jgi:AcrR family transcriptional regulator